ncbi:MAG TPA: SIMPL domain-containing protein [Bryobacteraceae bacterium]|jgi:hypothetical protein|nr:SIMPL domain-containing protein [Bryobacteraceae bacterium]
MYSTVRKTVTVTMMAGWFTRLFIGCLFMSIVSLCGAQEKAAMRFVRASGEASVSAKPDRAEINIGVSSRAASAQAAATENAEQSTKLQDAIRRVLGDAGKVKTSGYSLAPQYDYSNGHAPRLNGYEANNTVNVTLDDLARLGKAIDSATANGANNINGIEFTLKDSSAVRAQALGEAAVKARSNAEAIARALGLEVTGVLQAEPTEAPVVRPLMRSIGMAAGGALKETPSTPVQAGDLDIRATVTVTLAVR